MQEAQDLIKFILEAAQKRGEIKFKMNDGSEAVLVPPFSNVANMAIAGTSFGNATMVLIASIAVVTIPAKPDELNKPINYPKTGIA